jgi:hypothetical protein
VQGSRLPLKARCGDVHAGPQPEQEWDTIRVFEGVRGARR